MCKRTGTELEWRESGATFHLSWVSFGWVVMFAGLVLVCFGQCFRFVSQRPAHWAADVVKGRPLKKNHASIYKMIQKAAVHTGRSLQTHTQDAQVL